MKNASQHIRQSVGIDVSKDTLDVAICVTTKEFALKTIATSCFENNSKGITKLVTWVIKNAMDDLDLHVVMEATGVYHEKLAYHLYDKSIKLSIVMAGKVNAYFKSTDNRNINDKISARIIAEFGLGRKLEPWTAPSPTMRRLKTLSRERLQLQSDKNSTLNRRHAFQNSAIDNPSTLKRSNSLIATLKKQIEEIEQEIKSILNDNPELQQKIAKVCTIKGVGFITAVTIIAETDGFALIRNYQQLVCYAGYDVVKKESGTSVRKGGSISHKGNSNIRKALYFPAISAQQHSEFFSEFFDRLHNRHAIKMKAYVAIQRKVLILIYTLWKNNEAYNPAKHKNHIFLEQPKKAALTELDHVRS